MRILGTAFLLALALGGCKKDVEQLDPKAVGAGEKAAGWLVRRADEERTSMKAQQEELDAKLKYVQSLINSALYDQAEVALAGVFWRPVTPGSRVDKEFVQQYDERREALAKIIAERRTRAK
jgi:hypothetical protein